jgi:pimeloyl-ACP methyl ester carboxylesterase
MTTTLGPSGPQTVRANGVTIAYETFGRSGDPPLVLVMGLATQMIVWDDDFCAALAAQGRFVVRFDNRDIGLSDRLPDARIPGRGELLLSILRRNVKNPPYTLRDMAGDTLGLMDALGLDRVDLVGISMGGAIGQEIAIEAPERLRTLTLIMAASGNPKLPLPKPRGLRALLRTAPSDREGYLKAYVDTWRALAGKDYPIDPERTLEQGRLSYERGPSPAGAVRQLLAIVASGNRVPKLAEVRTPTLIIHGTDDPLVRVESAADLARAIPGARVELIDGMGHTLPRAVWPRVLAALERHAPPRP